MTQDSSTSLQVAHISLLKADSVLSSFVSDRVYDYVPEFTPYPYVIYHIPDQEEWDTSTDNGDEHSVYIHVYDDREGSLRTRAILQRIYELLHTVTALTLVNHKLVNCRRVSRVVEREGQLYHGIGIFRAVTEEN